MDAIMPIITDAAITILTALLALMAAYATRWINEATRHAQAESERIEDAQFRDFADEALGRVDDLATKTVARIEQTTAKTMREAIKAGTGNFTKRDLEALGRSAVREIIESLTPDYRDAIARTVGNLERYVTSTVETKVLQLKSDPYIVFDQAAG